MRAWSRSKRKDCSLSLNDETFVKALSCSHFIGIISIMNGRIVWLDCIDVLTFITIDDKAIIL